MAFRPRKFNSELKQELISVCMRQSKTGDLFFSVDYVVNGEHRFISFEKMSSVVDFINSNF